MKIFKKSKINFIKILFFKTKIPKLNNNINNFLQFNLDNTLEFNFKMKLNIIYKYHSKGKYIFFVGFSSLLYNNFLNIIEKTRHVFLTEKIWMNGVLSNRQIIIKYIQKINDEKLNILLQIKKKPNLVVMANKNKDIIKEVSRLKIPIIFITDFKKFQNYITDHINKIFFLLILSIFKKFETRNKLNKKLKMLKKLQSIIRYIYINMKVYVNDMRKKKMQHKYTINCIKIILINVYNYQLTLKLFEKIQKTLIKISDELKKLKKVFEEAREKK